MNFIIQDKLADMIKMYHEAYSAVGKIHLHQQVEDQKEHAI